MSDECSLQLLIVVVTFNSEATIGNCLANLQLLEPPSAISAHVVIVDNASRDTTVEIVQRFLAANPNFPATLVRSASNRGWGAGNNLGLANAPNRPSLVLFHNPDVSVGQDSLIAMTKLIGMDCNYAAVVPCFLASGGARVGVLPHPRLGWMILDGMIQQKRAKHKLQKELMTQPEKAATSSGYPSGALVLIRVDIFDIVGGFDERYLAYWDDVDIGRRLSAAGYLVASSNASIATHDRGSGSQIPGEDDTSRLRRMIYTHSQLQFISKWYGPSVARLVALYKALLHYRILSLSRRCIGKRTLDFNPSRLVCREFMLDGRMSISRLEYLIQQQSMHPRAHKGHDMAGG